MQMWNIFSKKDAGRSSTSIFISYRRKDSNADAGRIYDRLVTEFGDDKWPYPDRQFETAPLAGYPLPNRLFSSAF